MGGVEKIGERSRGGSERAWHLNYFNYLNSGAPRPEFK